MNDDSGSNMKYMAHPRRKKSARFRARQLQLTRATQITVLDHAENILNVVWVNLGLEGSVA